MKYAAIFATICALALSPVDANAQETAIKLSPTQQIMQEYQSQLNQMAIQRQVNAAQISASHRPGERGSILRQTQQAKQDKLYGQKMNQPGVGQGMGQNGQLDQPQEQFNTYAPGYDRTNPKPTGTSGIQAGGYRQTFSGPQPQALTGQIATQGPPYDGYFKR